MGGAQGAEEWRAGLSPVRKTGAPLSNVYIKEEPCRPSLAPSLSLEG